MLQCLSPSFTSKCMNIQMKIHSRLNQSINHSTFPIEWHKLKIHALTNSLPRFSILLPVTGLAMGKCPCSVWHIRWNFTNWREVHKVKMIIIKWFPTLNYNIYSEHLLFLRYDVVVVIVVVFIVVCIHNIPFRSRKSFTNPATHSATHNLRSPRSLNAALSSSSSFVVVTIASSKCIV